MTDTNYLYEYFLANSPDQKEEDSEPAEEDDSLVDEDK